MTTPETESLLSCLREINHTLQCVVVSINKLTEAVKDSDRTDEIKGAIKETTEAVNGVGYDVRNS